MGEAGPAERAAGARRGGVAKFVCGTGCGAALAASIHAVYHGRVVAPIAATARSEIDRAGFVSGGADGVEKRAGAGGVFAGSGSDCGATKHPRGNERTGREEES